MNILKYLLIFLATVVITVLVITLTPLKNFIINSDLQPPSEAPILISPINQSKEQLLTPNLSWKPVPGATFYLLCIREAVTNDIILNRSIRSTSFTVPENYLTENEKYTWAVAGGNSKGNGPFSEPRYFTTLPPYVNFLVQDENGKFLQGIKVSLFGEDYRYAIYSEQEKFSDSSGSVSFPNFRMKTAVFLDPSETHYPYIFSLEEKNPGSKIYTVKMQKMLKSTITRTREIFKSNINAEDLEILGWRTVRSSIIPITEFVTKQNDQIVSITKMLNQAKEPDTVLSYLLVVGPVPPTRELAINYITTPGTLVAVGRSITAAERLLADHIYNLITREINRKNLNTPGSQLYLSLMNYKRSKLLIVKWWYTF